MRLISVTMNVLRNLTGCVIMVSAATTAVAQDSDISIHITKCEGINPLVGVVEYYISTDSISAESQMIYDVTLTYTIPGESKATTLTETARDRSSNIFEIHDLTPATTINAQIEVSALLPGKETPETVKESINLTTPAVPILIGTLPGGVWAADYGIEGTPFDSYPQGECYYYTTSFIGEGAFRFISQFGRNQYDWQTVDKEPIYAPAQDRVDALNDHWYPYEVYIDTNSGHAWRIPNFKSDDSSVYTIQFDFKQKGIWISYQGEPTGIDPTNIEHSDELVDVYNLQGILLRKEIKKSIAFDGLDRGLYIVGREKVFVQ